MSKKILICAPKLNLLGGVANFYRMLKPYFTNEIVFLLKGRAKTLPEKVYTVTFFSIRIFFYLLFHRKIETVLLNPSLEPNAVRRDMFFAFIITKIFHRNLAVFWRGWNEIYEKKVECSMLPAFHKTFFKAKKMFVLSSAFRKKLLEWGYKGEVVLMTTCFEDDLLNGVVRHEPVQSEVSLLYLSRVEEAKGIFIVIDTLALLQKRNPTVQYKLCIAGDGTAMQQVRAYVAKKGIPNIRYTGYIRGNEKKRVFGQSDIFFLPSYGEGMPGALLEAMGAGLQIVTRSVGGIPDFFEQGKMGFITDSKDPKNFAEAIEKIVWEHPDFNFSIKYNCQYAKEHFTASKVSQRLLETLSDMNV